MSDRQYSFIRIWAPLFLSFLIGSVGAVSAYSALVTKYASIAAVTESNDARLFEKTKRNEDDIAVLRKQLIDQNNVLIAMQADLRYLVQQAEIERKRYQP